MAPEPFLSDAWLEQARATKAAHAGSRIDSPGLVVNATLTGVPFGDPVRHLHSERGPVIGFEEGHHPEAAVTITLDYALAREMVNATTYDVLDQAVSSGAIQIAGDTDQLRAWWKLRIANPDAVALDDELRGLTS